MIFFSFVMTAYIYYGPLMEQYRDVHLTFNTLFKFLLADLGDDFNAMAEINFWFTFWFFTIFITAMQFILLNMFVAFIANSYGYVNRTIQTNPSKEELLLKKHWLNKLSDCFRSCCKVFAWCREACRKKREQRAAKFKKGVETSQPVSRIEPGSSLLMCAV